PLWKSPLGCPQPRRLQPHPRRRSCAPFTPPYQGLQLKRLLMLRMPTSASLPSAPACPDPLSASRMRVRAPAPIGNAPPAAAAAPIPRRRTDVFSRQKHTRTPTPRDGVVDEPRSTVENPVFFAGGGARALPLQGPPAPCEGTADTAV